MPWGDGDTLRATFSGKQMRFKAALVQIKVDWQDLATTHGFPNWQDALRPCWGCNAEGDGLFDFVGVTLTEAPWTDNVRGDYANACSRCELRRALTKEQHALIAERLAYDKRSYSNSSKGLALVQDVPEADLLQGDRLEPCRELPDVGGFFDLQEFPSDVLFWRPSRESSARHRNPLFSGETGLDPVDGVTVDPLHALYLGVMKDWCRYAIWTLIQSGMFGAIGGAEEQAERFVIILKFELSRFYWRRRREKPHEPLTEVGNITAKMLGTNDNRKLKTKAAETWGLLMFINDFLSNPTKLERAGPEGKRMVDAGGAMALIVHIMAQHGIVMPQFAVVNMLDAWKRFLSITEDLAELKTPKRHAIVHMIRNTPRQGNPRCYANWLDESLNKVLKRCCREIAQSTFESNVLLAMAELLKTGYKRPRDR